VESLPATVVARRVLRPPGLVLSPVAPLRAPVHRLVAEEAVLRQGRPASNPQCPPFCFLFRSSSIQRKVTAFTEIEPRLLSLARDADTDALAICSFLFQGHQVRLPYFVRYAGNSPRVSPSFVGQHRCWLAANVGPSVSCCAYSLSLLSPPLTSYQGNY
jgi:hypothetical protein